MVHQQLLPGEGGFLVLPPLLEGIAQPEPVPRPQRRGQLFGRDGVEGGDDTFPVAGQEPPPHHLPLKIPAGRILGPALEHGQDAPSAAVA